MKIRYFYFLMISSIIIIGCKSNKTYGEEESNKVLLTQSAEMSTQPSSQNSAQAEVDYIKLVVTGKTIENFAITLYRNDTADYHGMQNASPHGKHTGKIPPELHEAIFKQVDSIMLSQLKTDMTGGMGGAIYHVTFNRKGETKNISYKQAARLGLQNLQTEIIKAKNSISWN